MACLHLLERKTSFTRYKKYKLTNKLMFKQARPGITSLSVIVMLLPRANNFDEKYRMSETGTLKSYKMSTAVLKLKMTA